MGRPVTLFTGQWADLPLETLCKKAREFGYDGLELACWAVVTRRLACRELLLAGIARLARRSLAKRPTSHAKHWA